MRRKQKSRKTSMERAKSSVKRKKAGLLNYRVKLFLTYSIIFCLISAVCLFFSSAILFKIKEIDVRGDNVCEAQILIEKSGIKNGDNLFLADTAAASARLESEIPEIDTVVMEKKFPNRLIMEVRKAQKSFCIEFDGKYIFVSNKGKALEVSDERDESLIFLKGISLDSFAIGAKIDYADKSVEKKISEFTEKMRLNGLPKVTEINFNNVFSFLVIYDNRIKINFGFYENMDYKIKTAAEIIINKLGAAESGTLNLSEISKENRSYFTPDY